MVQLKWRELSFVAIYMKLFMGIFYPQRQKGNPILKSSTPGLNYIIIAKGSGHQHSSPRFSQCLNPRERASARTSTSTFLITALEKTFDQDVDSVNGHDLTGSGRPVTIIYHFTQLLYPLITYNG